MTLISLLSLLFRFEPILLTIILAAIRPKNRRVVPVLLIITNLVLFAFLMIQQRGSSGYGSSPLLILYPFVCLAILFLGLIIETVFGAVRTWRNTDNNKGIENSALRGNVLNGDLATIFLVVANTVALLAPKATGIVALCFLVFMSASRLIGTAHRWIVAALLLKGCALLLDLSLFLISSASFQDLTGLWCLHNSIPLSWFGPYRWFGGLADVLFGVAVFYLCRNIKTLTSSVTQRR